MQKRADVGFYIETISVGKGDSLLLTLDTPDGGEAHVLIDGGDGEKADTIIAHAKKYAAGHLALVVGAHFDGDHIGALISLIED